MINKYLAGFGVVVSVIAVVLVNDTQNFLRIDANGPKLRMQILGSGTPTVVFENGGGASLELWGSVPARVSEFARVVRYDRAGDGLSDKGITEREGRNIASELHSALRNANISPPYVLVGHSLGGLYARIFAGMYPTEVAGMVLVDPTQEEMIDWNVEHGFSRSVDSARFRFESLRQARESAVPPGIPVYLIHVALPWPHGPFPSKYIDESAARLTSRLPLTLRFHREWVERTPGAQLITTDLSSHGAINLEEPDLVADIIHKAVEGTKRLPP